MSSAGRVLFLVGVRHMPFQRGNIQRRRQVIDDGVQQRLHALVLEGGTAHHRHELEAVRTFADAALQIRDARHLAFEIGFEKRLVFLDGHLDKVGVKLLGLVLKVGRDFHYVEFRAELLLVPNEGLHFHKVDDTFEVCFRADRPSDHQGPAAQPVDHHLHATRKIRAHAVHLVDEADARHAVLVGLAPDRFGLRLHARHRVEHGNGAVEHAHRTLHLDGEVDMARRVDDVDPVFAPVTGRGGRRDGDAALLLLLHEIHGGGAVVHFADLMALARVIENALGRRRLAGIDMRGNADVAIFLERGGSGHLEFRYQR